MAISFSDKMGLNPKDASTAAEIASSTAQAAEAAKRFEIETKLGFKNMVKQVDASKKLVDDAKINQALLKKKLRDNKDHIKQLVKEKASNKVIAEAKKKSSDLSKEVAATGKIIKKNEKELTELTKEKAEVEETISTEMNKQNKFGNILLGVFSGLVALGAEFLSRTSEVRDSLGGTVASAEKLQPILQNVTANLADQGINWEKTQAAAAAIFESTKNLADVTEKNIANVALVSQKFGVSVTDTAKIAETMKAIGGYSMEQSTNMVAFASAAAEAAGVAPKDVMADIANSAETAAKFFGDNPKALAKAAIEARRLGLTLDDMAGVSNKLLEVEQNIEDQFTAQVLTGKQFNFDAARRLALEGDIEGATKSILGQMGSIDDFNKMDVIQKEAVAAAAGLTVTQLSTALTKQKAINDMTDEQKAKYEKLLGDMDAANQSEADKLLKQTESLATQEKFNAAVDSLKEILISEIMPFVEDLQPYIKRFLDWFKGIVTAVREWGGLLKPIIGIMVAMKAKAMALGVVEAGKAVAKIFAANAWQGPVGIATSLGTIAAMVGSIAAVGSIFMAEGGISTGPTNAVIGDNPSGIEAVIPLERAGEMGFGGTPTIDNSKLIEKIDELIGVVKTAKPINMDGAKVGEAIWVGSIQSGAA